MLKQTIPCEKHGRQEFAVACIHICRAIEQDAGDEAAAQRDTAVGFYWSDDTEAARPDAWCAACEAWACKHANAPVAAFMKEADFQFICVQCWDDARHRFGGEQEA